jgi:hypothetical protein
VTKTRAALTWFLLVAAALLSFDALTHRAESQHIVANPLFYGVLSVHFLDQIWALTIDVLAAVGVLGLKLDRRDIRAWVALGLGLGLSMAFQSLMLDSWGQRGMAAVPPIALSMAVWIFEVPRRTVARPAGERSAPIHAESTVGTEALPMPQTPGTVPREPVSVLSRADEQALRRVRDDRAAVDRIAAKRAIDPDTVEMLLSKWNQRVPAVSSNGHRPTGERAA